MYVRVKHLSSAASPTRSELKTAERAALLHSNAEKELFIRMNLESFDDGVGTGLDT